MWWYRDQYPLVTVRGRCGTLSTFLGKSRCGRATSEYFKLHAKMRASGSIKSWQIIGGDLSPGCWVAPSNMRIHGLVSDCRVNHILMWVQTSWWPHITQIHLGHHFELGQLAEFASPDNRKVMHVNASNVNEGDDLAKTPDTPTNTRQLYPCCKWSHLNPPALKVW